LVEEAVDWLRSASRLSCGVPEVALVNPGNSKITHEPAAKPPTLMDMDGLSVTALISVPPRIVVAPLALSSRHCG